MPFFGGGGKKSCCTHTEAVCANTCKLRPMQASTCGHILWRNVPVGSLAFVVEKKNSSVIPAFIPVVCKLEHRVSAETESC